MCTKPSPQTDSMSLANPLYTACITVAGMITLIIVHPAIAAPHPTGGQAAGSVGIVFLWIAVILLAAKLSNLVTRIGQPPVLGELLVGVALGNLALVGFNAFEPINHRLRHGAER